MEKRRRKRVKTVVSKGWKWKRAWQLLGTGLLEVKGAHLGAESGVLDVREPPVRAAAHSREWLSR